MSHNETDFAKQAAALVQAGRFLHGQGWVPATSGNFSARLDSQTLAITVSGRHKGELTLDDIMLADMEGRSLQADKRPSAETLLHTQLYRRFPHVGAVLHTHSLNATLVSRLAQEKELVLEDYELLKAFAGIDSHDTTITVPVFGNDQDIPRLAQKVDAYMDNHAPVHGYLIQGHGIYTWGRDVATTLHYLEAFEYLFACELKLREIRP
jgi:methylthioribulose-1-phosphate dehydratase